MKKLILTAATALALAASPVATAPAKAAEPSDLVGALLGLAVLGVIVNEVRDDDDDKKARRREAERREAERREAARRERNRYDQHYDWHRRNGARRDRILPGGCLRVVEGRHAERFVFPERCLKRQGIRERELPARCENRLPTRNGRVDVYGARCLADAGWRLPRIAARR